MYCKFDISYWKTCYYTQLTWYFKLSTILLCTVSIFQTEYYFILHCKPDIIGWALVDYPQHTWYFLLNTIFLQIEINIIFNYTVRLIFRARCYYIIIFTIFLMHIYFVLFLINWKLTRILSKAPVRFYSYIILYIDYLFMILVLWKVLNT